MQVVYGISLVSPNNVNASTAPGVQNHRVAVRAPGVTRSHGPARSRPGTAPARQFKILHVFADCDITRYCTKFKK